MNNKRYKKRPKPIVEDNYIPPFDAGAMNVPIEILNLNEATYTLLKGANYNNILDLVKKTEKDFYKITKFNKKNLLDVILKLKYRGLFLKPMPEVTEEKEIKSVEQTANSNNAPISIAQAYIAGSKKPAPTKALPQKTENRTDNNAANNNSKKERTDYNNNNNKAKPNIKEEKKTDNRPKTIETLRLSGLTLKNMKAAGYKYIDDVITKTENDIMKIKGFKKKDLFHLLERLDAVGLALGGQEVEVKRKRPVRDIVKDEPDIFVKINKNGKWGFQDRSGKLVVPAVYDEVYNYKEDMCCVEKEEKYGFINRKGEEIVPIEYDCACSFSEGYAFVIKKDKGGYVDKENNQLTEFIFDAGTVVLNGNCRVKKDGKWGELFINNPNEIRWII